MKITIDFKLNTRFGIVEQIVFRLVLNGYSDARGIFEALPIFSDSVIANGIKTLVNRQIITAEVGTGKLSISEPILAIIEMCLDKEYEIEVPTEMKIEDFKEGIVISNSSFKEEIDLKQTILYQLLPGVKMDMYIDSLDFILREKRQ